MHLADFGIGMLGANGIVGAGIPIVTGAGLAAQLEGKGRVAVSFFGDGASNAGPFHESINIASAWKLPVIYVCENNHYAVNTPSAKSLAFQDVAARAAGYGIPGVIVDGNDIMAIYEAAASAIARARAGDGPTLIECKTYRWRAHTERPTQPDYRDPAEVESWKKKDPIARLVALLKQQQGQFSDEEWETLDKRILQAIEDSVGFAKASPFPAPDAALEDVYAD
jgi:pyruvate dehydrogenase E1 component alpha subunit